MEKRGDVMKPCKEYLLFGAVLGSILGLIVLLVIGCGGGSSGGGSSAGGTSGVSTETLSLGPVTQNVQFTAGQRKEFKFTYAFPGDITSRGDYKINVKKTLENITLSSAPSAGNTGKFEMLRLLAHALVKEAFAAETAQVTTYISFAGDPDVCSSPFFIGPRSITGQIGSAPTSTGTTLTLTQAAADIVNMGSFDICVVTTPPIDVYVTVPGVVVDFQPCAAPTVDLVGSWSGTYQCENSGSPPESGTVALAITRNPDGSYHYVDDGGAEYDGHLCGNKFRFKGGKAGSYTESGTLVANGNSATKTSLWRNEFATARGVCSDVLQKN
jgi:hypothetical protein